MNKKLTPQPEPRVMDIVQSHQHLLRSYQAFLDTQLTNQGVFSDTVNRLQATLQGTRSGTVSVPQAAIPVPLPEAMAAEHVSMITLDVRSSP